MNAQRVLVVGIDAATLDLLEPYIAEGALPNMARLFQQGSYAPLRSTLPVMSPPAWTTMITGQNPGKHGLYDFIRFQPGTYRAEGTRSDQTSFRTLFDLATQHGKRVIAMNIPLTYPPRPVNGIMISGPVVPTRGTFTHPPELSDELRNAGYLPEVDVKYIPGNDGEFIQAIKDVTRNQADTLKRLMQQHEWDLAFCVLRGVDEVMAFFWHHMDPEHHRHDPEAAKEFGTAIRDVHVLVDQVIGELADIAGPNTTIMLVSDHGGGPCYKEVFLNVWLERQGWLVRKKTASANQLRQQIQRRVGFTRENLLPLLENPLVKFVRDRVPERVRLAVVPPQVDQLAESIDWSKTKAYSIGNIGQIYINQKGREPEGIVAPGAERDALLDEITAALYQMTDNGTPVVDEVHRSDTIYHGPYAHYGPDLNILMRGMTYITQSWRELAGNELFGDSGAYYSGTHRPVGFVAMAGNAVARNGKQPELQIADVAPTLMWLLDLPLPDDLDGKLMAPLLKTRAIAQRPPRSISAEEAPAPAPTTGGWASADEEAEVLDRLRDLGYLE